MKLFLQLLNIIGVLLFISLFDFGQAYDRTAYLCSICLSSVENMDPQNANAKGFMDGCAKQFSERDCVMFFSENSFENADKLNAASVNDPRQACRELSFCPSMESNAPWKNKVSSSEGSNLDIRVSRAMGTRGYDKVRVSLISNSSVSSSIFDYSAQFKYKWTQNYLNTGIVTITPGEKTTISVTPTTDIEVFIPKEGAGVRGVILADPCFQSEWIVCVFQDKFQMYDRTIALLNAINAHDDNSFWQILGDNFYDQTGEASASWFNGLSMATKSKVFASVPGNHDFWVNAMPVLEVPADQLGNGFMQFYGQDVVASIQQNAAGSTSPYDFSVSPTTGTRGSTARLPKASDFFFYNKMGNIGFIGYSGTYTFAEMTAYFNDACTWATSADVDVLLLLGHWNGEGDGCPADASVPAAYKELMSLPACAAVAPKMKYFMGHKHCNYVTETDIGFMVGAVGMADSDCVGTFGIPVVDSTDGKFNVYYFPISQAGSSGFDNYDGTLSCFLANGVSGCYHLAQLWSSTSLGLAATPTH